MERLDLVYNRSVNETCSEAAVFMQKPPHAVNMAMSGMVPACLPLVSEAAVRLCEEIYHHQLSKENDPKVHLRAVKH